MSASQNQFSLSRVATINRRRVKKQFPINFRPVKVRDQVRTSAGGSLMPDRCGLGGKPPFIVSRSSGRIRKAWSVPCALSLALVGALSASLRAGAAGSLSAVWANNGQDKVTQEQLRASNNQSVTNSVWDGTHINQFGAKNEVVEFNLILEANTAAATNVSVTMGNLTGPGGSLLRSAARGTNDLFNWTGTEAELYYVRYLPIVGTSGIGYEGGRRDWAEAVFPKSMQCPGMTQPGGPDSIPSDTGCTWTNRPGANKYFPDIAVPMELVPSFTIARGNNQAVWADIYIPKTAAAGMYTGNVFITENGMLTHAVPVNLTVRNFTLPDVPSSKTMLVTAYGDISLRYTGVQWPNPGSLQDQQTVSVLQNQMLLAHRHKISLIDDNFHQGWNADQPAAAWLPFLSGAGFTATNGYAGPGAGVGNNVFSIGTYGSWTNDWGYTSNAIVSHCNDWEGWFEANSPFTERFLYLIDEPTNYVQTEQWAKWIKTSPGPGSNLYSLATVQLILRDAYNYTNRQPANYTNITTLIPDLSIPVSTGDFAYGPTNVFQSVVDSLHAQEPNRRVYYYNPKRPGGGHLAIVEDDGVSPREAAWAMFKKGIDRLFYWEGTYYDDSRSGRGYNHLFTDATTFGASRTITTNSAYGLLSPDSLTSNGDGVLLFPGTDAVFNEIPYHVPGPFAGLCLKVWRRGVQDVDYLTLARAINPAAVSNLVSTLVPMALWEVPPHDPVYDPTYTYRPITWTNNPDLWEAARLQLANIMDPQPALLQIRRSSETNLEINWTPSNSLLLEATNLTGPWKTNPGAVPPLIVSPTNVQRFFRLIVQ
jgi:Family of unknown function (DUF6067)/Domain of unknown function (DUF4091)